MRHFAALLAGILLLAASGLVFAQSGQPQAEEQSPFAKLPWVFGPATGKIGSRATIKVPEGYAFLGAEGTARFNEIAENPPTSTDEYIVAPTDLHWVAFFDFSDTGYVRDNEKLDPDDILSSLREGTEAGNVERKKRGWDTMNILGWSFQPQYDKKIKALEWAILAQMEKSGSKVVNYNTRLLGRHGVMEVVVVADPESLTASIANFKELVPGYEFSPGEKYAEFKEGDHVAEYGLAALITGGAAAVAAKKGWLAGIGIFLLKIWKLLLIGVAAVTASFRKIFKRGGDDDSRA
jgi:uncharacterized membrane-anchored protein